MARGPRIDWSKVDFGRPAAEIAAELGCSVPAVYTAKKKFEGKSAAEQSTASDSSTESAQSSSAEAPAPKAAKKKPAKDTATIGFEKQIWDAACELWGHIPAADYRKVIVGLIFLRYVSGAFERRYNELVAEGDGFENERDAYEMENVFFIPEEARWNVIAEAAHTPEIGTVIDGAMRAIEKENSSLKNVLPKVYGNPDLDKKVLGNVVDIFTNNIILDDSDKGKDLLGRTYEYCIAQFAAYEGKKGGEFYTPASIVNAIRPGSNPRKSFIVYKRLEGLLFLLKLPLLASSVISESLFASTKFVAIFVATWDSLRWQHFKVATFGR